jgi:hypothetical protein
MARLRVAHATPTGLVPRLLVSVSEVLMMKRFPAGWVSIGILFGCLLALISVGCGRSDSPSSNPDPDTVKQESDRLRQENEKMFKK